MKGKKTGGRKKGTPNANNPIKNYLRDHSITYFQPTVPETDDATGKKTGRLLSQFDLDMADLDPYQRADMEMKMLKYHTPQMQSVEAEVEVADTRREDLFARISALAQGDN